MGKKVNKIEKRVYINLDYCIGCKSCVAACMYANNFCEPYADTAKIREDVTLPFICRHCEEPLCVKSCPNEALAKTESGVVVRYTFKCTGCRQCVLACPFGAIPDNFAKTKISPKCNLCENRVLKGDKPACVSTCSSGALRFLTLEEAEKEGTVLGSRIIGRTPYIRRR